LHSNIQKLKRQKKKSEKQNDPFTITVDIVFVGDKRRDIYWLAFASSPLKPFPTWFDLKKKKKNCSKTKGFRIPFEIEGRDRCICSRNQLLVSASRRWLRDSVV
jgi:hypothetical protein